MGSVFGSEMFINQTLYGGHFIPIFAIWICLCSSVLLRDIGWAVCGILLWVDFLIIGPFMKFISKIKGVATPRPGCNNIYINKCNGMPSGHTQTMGVLAGWTLVGAFLGVNKQATTTTQNWFVAYIASIGLVAQGVQRIITKMHTPPQVSHTDAHLHGVVVVVENRRRGYGIIGMYV